MNDDVIALVRKASQKVLSSAFRFAASPAPRRVLLLALVMALHAGSADVVRAAEPPKDPSTRKVLILSSYGVDFAGGVVLIQTLHSTLRKGSPVRIQFYQEYLESPRIPEGKYEEELVGFLKRKYEGEQIDLTVAVGASALRVMLKHRANLLPDVPIIYFYYEEEFADPVGRATGVWVQPDYRKTLEIALALHPEVENVFVVGGNSQQDRLLFGKSREQFREYEGKIGFTYLTDMTLEEFRQRLASLPKKSIVIFISVFLDRAGRSYSGPEALSLLTPSIRVPLYGMSRTFLGSGVVGGSVLDFELIGGRVGEIGLRVLGGERPEDIPPQTVPSVTMFDWRELRRWGIKEENLPPGSQVLFKQQSLLEQYRLQIAAGVTLLIAETLLIAGLFVNRARWVKGQKENARLALLAEEARRGLEEVVSNVPGIVWEARGSEPGNRTVQFVSDYAEKLLGYGVEDWLSTPGFLLSIIPDEDRERVAREIEAALGNGKKGVIQFRWMAKNGRVLWAEAHVAPILDGAGRLVGMRGVTLDVTERKLAEHALGESEQKTRDILRAIPDLMFLQSPDGVYLDYHAGDPRALLAPPAVFLGKNMREVLPPELAENLFLLFRRLQATGETQVLDYPLTILGKERWFETRVVDNGGNILSVVRDITDRKQAEEALAANRRQLAGIIDSAMDAIISIDGYQRIVVFNAAAEQMFGCSAAEAIGQSIARFVPERFREAHTSHVRGFGATKVTKRSMGALGALYGLRADGEEFPIEASISQVNSNGQRLYTVILRDITQRKQAEDALRESEERFRIMADTAPVMIWVSSPDNRCTYVNQQWLDFTGRTIEQELGRGWIQGVHRDDYESCLETFGGAFDLRQPFRREYRLRRADGEFRWVLDSGTPRFSPGGDFLGFIGSCIDITEHKAAEDGLRNLSGQLIRAREDECARIARELHDDLSQRMALFSVELEQLGLNPPDTHDKLRSNLKGVMNQIKETSREIHRMSYDLHPSKLVHLGLVTTVAGLCEELARRHGLKIEFTHENVPADLPQDVSLCLYRIVQECLNNVIRHSGAQEAQVSLRLIEDEIRLRVVDSGIGFDLESPRLKKGLGLAGMRERLRLVGGRISIDSGPSQGTQIDATIPLLRAGLEGEDDSPQYMRAGGVE